MPPEINASQFPTNETVSNITYTYSLANRLAITAPNPSATNWTCNRNGSGNGVIHVCLVTVLLCPCASVFLFSLVCHVTPRHHQHRHPYTCTSTHVHSHVQEFGYCFLCYLSLCISTYLLCVLHLFFYGSVCCSFVPSHLIDASTNHPCFVCSSVPLFMFWRCSAAQSKT